MLLEVFARDPLFPRDPFINDNFLFIDKSDICKFVDNNTLFSCGDSLSVMLSNFTGFLYFVPNILSRLPDTKKKSQMEGIA